MAQAAIAAGTAAVDVAKGLFTEMNNRKGGDSARSMQVVIRNTTGEKLVRSHHESHYGKWTSGLEPLPEIDAETASGFMLESHGLMTGCGGMASYEIGDSGEKLRVSVSVPYAGANSNSANVEGGSRYKVSAEGGGGNNATYSLKLEDTQKGQDEGDEDEEGGGNDDERNGNDDEEE
ncbi:uncharacterized protein AB675_10273 [Cyphellophora attinorum]|uniref:Uncharacterized protein n=1 Tax=Cyphellophora attinorum TaxID=1664694 RepID=A0A0N0NJW4_9EURO|nr:uncharacterized protein AB675_10273 [Phialophora attinorum]KPI37451.1 hypothetical protein AB675_10273 [Phialophora attinorum]